MVTVPDGLSQDQKIVLIRVLENGFSGADDPVDTAWLSRIEQAQMANPGDATLQYLAGVACLHLQLWGKAQQLLKLALPRLVDSSLLSRAWQILAELAQRQGDDAQAAVAWKNAAQISLRQKV
jgi:HemY protein